MKHKIRLLALSLGLLGLLPPTFSFALNSGPNQPMDGLQVVQSCGTMSPYGAQGGGTATIGLGGVLTVDTNGNLCTNATGGGGGGAVTLAAGAVAAGAYTSGSFVAGALADGAITTLGTEADTAWTSGSGTAIAILKAIATSAATTATNTGASVPSGSNNVGYFTPAPAGATSGASLYHHYSAATASGDTQFIKASAGTIWSIDIGQTSATAMELKLYNSTSAPTCSSATGILANIPIQALVTSPGAHLPFPTGLAFSTGIAFCIVALGSPPSDTDSGTPATGLVLTIAYQ